MRRGTVIKIVIVSALLVACIVGLTVYADGNHSTDKDTEVVQKTQKEKVIVEEPTVTAESTAIKDTTTVQEEFGPIRPVRAIQKEEVKEDDDGRISEANNRTGTDSENAEQADSEQVGDVIRETVPGDDSQGNADNEQVAGEDGGVSEVYEVEEPVAEELVLEEQVPEEQAYVEPVPEEPVYEEPAVEETVSKEPVYEEPQYEYLFTATATAYCPCEKCCPGYGYATASGRPPIAGHTIACNILPFYTQVMIDGVIYEVEDTGYTPYGDAWVDIYFDTHEEALAYGMRTVDVYLVRY